VWRSGSDKGISYCISLPISLARKYDIKDGDAVMASDVDNGILIQKLVLGGK